MPQNTKEDRAIARAKLAQSFHPIHSVLLYTRHYLSKRECVIIAIQQIESAFDCVDERLVNELAPEDTPDDGRQSEHDRTKHIRDEHHRNAQSIEVHTYL